MLNQLRLCFQPFPVLETERLDLTEVAEQDVDEVFFLRSHAQVLRYIHRKPAVDKAEVIDFIRSLHAGMMEMKNIQWALRRKKNQKLIGNIGLWNFNTENHRAEIGYAIHPDSAGLGLMNEALGAVLNYAFTSINFHSIEARVDPGNTSSRNLLERNGFVREGFFKEDIFFHESYFDTLVYSILNPAHS